MAEVGISTHTFKDIFSLDVVQLEKACVVNRPEQINAYHIYWIKNGKGTYNIDFKQFKFTDGVLFFLSPGQVFSVDSEKIKDAYKLSFVRDFYCIQIHDKEVSCNGVLFNNVYESPYVLPSEKDAAKLDLILENLIEEFKHNEAAQYDMLQAYLKQFIIQSVRVKKEYELPKEDKDSRLLKDFSLLVDQNYRSLHAVTDYSKRLGISPKSLAKHFQRFGSTTPSDIIKQRIILEAKRQLIYSDNTVKQIAYDLGFNDAAYFTRFFTKAVSKSPLQFKKDYKK